MDHKRDAKVFGFQLFNVYVILLIMSCILHPSFLKQQEFNLSISKHYSNIRMIYDDYEAERKITFDQTPIESYTPKQNLVISKYINPENVENVSMYHIIYKFPEPPMPNILRGKGPYEYPVFGYLTAAYRENVKIYHFKNVYFNNKNIYTDDSMVYFPFNQKSDPQQRLRVSTTVYDSVIIGRQHFPSFGHYVTDSPLFLMLNLPEEITKKSIFIRWGHDNGYSRNFLDTHGLSWIKHNWVSGDANLARNLYIAVSNDYVNGNLRTLMKIRDKVYSFYNVSIIKPHLGIITNRPVGKSRYVPNMNDFVEAAKKNFPEIEWRFEIDGVLTDIKRSIKIFVATKIYVVPPGSAAFKIMYMQKGTGLFIFGHETDDWANFIIAYSLNIWCTYSKNNVLHHYEQTTGPVDINYNIKYLRYLVYAVDHQMWPNSALNDNETVLLFDMKPVKEILAVDEDVSLLANCNFSNYLKYIKSVPDHFKHCGFNGYFKQLNDLPGKTQRIEQDLNFHNWTDEDFLMNNDKKK